VAFVVDGSTLATATGTVTVSPGAASDQAGDPAPPTGSGVATGPPLAPVDAADPPPGSGSDPIANTATTPAPRVPTIVTTGGSGPASVGIDVILDGLWAGLYTSPGSSSTGTSSPDLRSTSPIDPSQDPLLHWDRGLEILAP
jgi:hypothetical protein